MAQTSQIVTIVFIFFLLLKVIVEAYLDNKNKKCILANQDKVPETFAEKISLEDHQKAATYSLAKIKAKSIFDFIELVLLLAWTLGGGLNLVDQYIRTYQFTEIQTGLLVFYTFGLISFVLGLPQSIYSTFVLEEKFGFNKTTPKTFIVDIIKSTLIGFIIITPILYGVLYIMMSLGSLWWMYAWAFITLFQFVLIWAYPRFLAPLFNKFTPLEDGEIKDKIVHLFKRTGFETNGLFVMDASKRSAHGNAYFTGFGKNKRIVFFDNLIKTLEASEVEAVMAHELGHFKRKHIVKNLVKGVLFSFIGFSVLGFLSQSIPFFHGHGVSIPSSYMALLLFSLVMGQYTFLLTPIHSWFSRKYEFEADTFAHENSNGNDLISALVKMYKDNASTLTPDPTYSAFYHSHPPALIRVKFLQSLLENKK